MRFAPALVVVLVAVGCGTAKKPVSAPPPGAAMEARLKALGYSVTDTAPVPHQPYVRAFSVDHIDWTSPGAFNVSVFIFSTRAQAEAHRERTAGLVGRFPPTNRSKLIGPYLFVATADTVSSLCTLVNGSLRCPTTSGIRIADFEKVISVARGR